MNSVLAQAEVLLGSSVYLQLAAFMFTFGAGIAITRLLLVPAASALAGRRSDSKKLVHQSRNFTTIIGILGSFLLALQAGEFGNLVTVIGTIAAALTVAIGFGMRDQVANLVAGVLIHLENPYVRGDQVKIGDQEGEVKEIGMRATSLNGRASEKISVPNGVVASNPLKNFTKGVKTKSSAEIKLKSKNAAAAEQILEELLHDKESVLESPAPFVRYGSIDSGRTVLDATYWIKDSASPKEVRSSILKQFNARAVEQGLFDAEDDTAEEDE